MFKTSRTFLRAAVLAAVTATSAQAALIDRGGGLIYDTVLNITWLADMNYARTQGYTGAGVNANGTMSWYAATTWASNLEFGGFTDWRLPTLNTTDITAGELGHLFVTDLGHKTGQSVLNTTGDTDEQKANLALFKNIQLQPYWSSVEANTNVQRAWYYITFTGGQSFTIKDSQVFAVAVRDGDVLPPTASDVPEPQSLALALLALGAAALTTRRRAQRP